MESFLDFLKKTFNSKEEEKVKNEEKKDKSGENEEETELVAAITAAIALYLQADVSGFYVKSIVRLPETVPVWAKVGRQEQMRTRL
ncbi:Oxaloacetate decarboxylase, gamma chain [Thermoanaerobacter uzonensis DSM 18761]|uniref:Oxaloacetate decarboxylase, gamma chain n=1 Tax=Thermoanaerobacter uzonensis DSM 18761 TaxID=1123369 RepID=A0A1M4YUI2_9THEO|nr:OadG family transporter subunit [Thermoanaerobacter uzonensis]SHF09142.1 Oxaloacetate decarboxylase, gamma chain [Thermoanaerobacter uzonensis DSM 18761]